MTQHPHPEVDPERPHAEKRFNRDEGYSGQDAGIRDEQRLAEENPSGTVAARPQDTGDGPSQRASLDPATGATRGSGAGPTEEFDTDDPTIDSGKDGGGEG